MKNFSFGKRMIYFGAIALISLAFFVLQLYSTLNGPSGIGSIVLLVLWGGMVLFGIGGMIFSYMTRDRTKK